MLSELLQLFWGYTDLEWGYDEGCKVGDMNPELEKALITFRDNERKKKDVKRSKEQLRPSTGANDLVHLYGLRDQPPRRGGVKPKKGFAPTPTDGPSND